MILTDEEALRVSCRDILTSEVEDVRLQLEKELAASAARGSPGIGLAAPQIGIPVNMAIIRLGKYNIDLVNATIVKSYDLSIFDNEGCLSFPGKSVRTRRFGEVLIKNGIDPYSFVATGLLAVVCQHELDHLRGVLLPDVEIIEQKIATKVRPNDLCLCGSGKKFKRCCGVTSSN